MVCCAELKLSWSIWEPWDVDGKEIVRRFCEDGKTRLTSRESARNLFIANIYKKQSHPQLVMTWAWTWVNWTSSPLLCIDAVSWRFRNIKPCPWTLFQTDSVCWYMVLLPFKFYGLCEKLVACVGWHMRYSSTNIECQSGKLWSEKCPDLSRSRARSDAPGVQTCSFRLLLPADESSWFWFVICQTQPKHHSSLSKSTRG